MRIEESINNLRTKVEGVGAGVVAAWDAFKGSTGMIPKEEQTIGNLKYAIRMNQEEMEPNEINFVDFNGMVLSMTIEEVMQLTEMPQPNEYYNLTFEKWSETLEEIQDGRCHTVGAFYHTTDGCNYYVVEVKAGDTVSVCINTNFREGDSIYWGDGNVMNTPSSWYGDLTHTYEKSGKYTIKWVNPRGFGTNYGEEKFKEIYLAEGINIGPCRYMTTLKKLCVSSSATGNISSFWGPQLYNLKALIVGDGVTGTGNMKYASVDWKRMEYIVANGCSIFELTSMVNLRAFSFKGATKTEGSNSYYIFPYVKNIVFDKITTIGNGIFSRGADYRNPVAKGGIIDLPETLQSIGNNSLRTCPAHVYLRTLTPPTLGGTSVFWWNDYGIKVTIHIRKDATYTDANGDTWTGLEAYAKATNWATLYASSNYTFIDDL